MNSVSRRRSHYLEVSVVWPFHPTIDRVELVSSVATYDLWQTLPIKKLKDAAAYFHIRQIKHPKSRYKSRIILICTPHADPIRLLFDSEPTLDNYVVSEAELAFDLPATSVEDAGEKLLWLACHIRKRNHSSGKVRVVSDAWEKPPPGCLNLPTLYFEYPSSTIALKLYARYEKLPGGKFGKPIVRVEWTLRGSALERHLGGKRLADLVVADLNEFLEKQICLEQVDQDQLELLLSDGGRRFTRTRRRKSTKLDDKFQRPLSSIFAHTGNVSETWTRDESEFVRRIRGESPAHIWGLLRRLRDGGQKSARMGQRRSRRRMKFSDHHIKKCFRHIPLETER